MEQGLNHYHDRTWGVCERCIAEGIRRATECPADCPRKAEAHRHFIGIMMAPQKRPEMVIDDDWSDSSSEATA
jgi:hypothetical protein